MPGAERDLVMLQGVEPSLRWRRFTDSVIELARELGARMVITLGALLADVPHTRPVADDRDRLGRRRWSSGSASSRRTTRGPTGIVGVLHHACADGRRFPSVSLWASVPHYVAAAPNPKAALALIRSFEGVAGVAVDARELEEAAEDYERQVNAAVATDPDVKASSSGSSRRSTRWTRRTRPTRAACPSADTIARDFQRFLRAARAGLAGRLSSLLGRRADDPVVAEAQISGDGVGSKSWLMIPSAISATVARTRSSSSSECSTGTFSPSST